MPAKRELVRVHSVALQHRGCYVLLFRLVIADAGKMKVILVSGIFVAVATCLVIAAADDEDYGEVRPPPLHNPDSCDAEYCGSICRQYACSRFRFCRGGRCTPRHTLPCLCIH
ncbi:uncharacterized protein LOC135400130 isoform X2 [Ornithodoros turicata]|uniref:uncharacterized protein LOC135400130 isoform X2 n=1 Tax=Ornithodoros turicata TaxID=34597 RepID=UPI00313A36F6